MISSAVCAAAVCAKARTKTTAAQRWMAVLIQRLCLASSRPAGGRAKKRSEDVTDLELECPRRIDIRERGNRIRCRANCNDLAERRVNGTGIAVSGLRATQDVRVIEQVEAFNAQQDRAAGRLQASLEEHRHIRSEER